MNTYMFELPPIVSIAFEVIAGKYGVGDERKASIQHEGYDYNKVQSCVNELVNIIKKYS